MHSILNIERSELLIISLVVSRLIGSEELSSTPSSVEIATSVEHERLDSKEKKTDAVENRYLV